MASVSPGNGSPDSQGQGPPGFYGGVFPGPARTGGSGYYVSTSDGASTCSSSTTEPGEMEGAGGTLLVLEPKSLRSFGTNDEYLEAMTEDLADWFSCLHQISVNPDNFFNTLETGVLLCKHANKVQENARQMRERGETIEMRSYFIRSIPERAVPFRENVKPETFQARDNVSNFISWGRKLGIPEVLSFETDDLVLRKNEKSVILCLLELARVGAKLGMLAPTLVQMEEEIDAELAGEETKPQVQIKTCDMRSLEERVRDLIGRCTCPVQFPMIKVGDGKYKIGDSRSLIFVRILRNHVMVRVGGGWDTLENYLNKHDPCQCNFKGHRSGAAQTAHKIQLSQSQNASLQQRRASTPGGGVTNASATPTSPRRMSNAPPPRHRSESPQHQANNAAVVQTLSTPPRNNNNSSNNNPRSKSPTLIISRHTPGGGAKGAGPSQSNFSVNRVASASPGQSRTSDSNSVSKSWSQPLPRPSAAGSYNKNCINEEEDSASIVSTESYSSSVTSQPNRCKSPSPGRLRTPSPRTVGKPSQQQSPASFNRSGSNSALPRPRGSAAVGRRPPSGSVIRSTSFDEKAEWSYDRRSPTLSEDRGFENDSMGGSSRDRTAGAQQAEKEDDKGGSVSMDKISTMTLNEFKSLLNSNLTVPDAEAASAQVGQAGGGGSSGGRSPASCSDSGLQHPPNWDSLREKARSLRDSMETARRTHVGRRSLPQSPDTHYGPPLPGNRTGSNSGNSSPVMSRPKTPTSSGIPRPKTPTSSLPVSRPKTPTSSGIARPKTPSGTSSYNTNPPREEYRMSRPKTPSQVKRDAVARVAGAISNWVESRPEATGRDSTNRPPSRPKTPTRPQSGRTSRCQDTEMDDDDDIDLEMAQFEQSDSLPAAARERPSTPSRIPKPCFSSNRPTTPKISNIPVPSSSSSGSSGPTQQRSQSAVPFSSTISARERDIQLRQQQLQRLQQELDEAQRRAAEEYQHEQQQQQQQQQYFGQHSTHPARPNFLPTSIATLSSEQYSDEIPETSSISNGRDENAVRNKIAVSRKLPLPRGSSNNTPAGGDKSYREIHTTRRCTTPVHSNGEPRHQPSRAVTPGPREKWSISGQFSRSVESGPTKGGTLPRPRRASLNSEALAERDVNSLRRYNRDHGSGGGDQSYQNNISNMAITNEITFSDDEEINELVRNVALSNSVSENSFRAEASRARPASAMDMHRSERQVTRRGSRGGDGEEVLMIHRNATGGHAVQVVGNTNSSSVKTKPTGIMRRPANTTTASPGKTNKSNVANSTAVSSASRFRSQTPDPSMFRQKAMNSGSGVSRKPIARPNTPNSASGAAGGGKSLNRTEAWVDSTLSDPKRKVISKTRRSRGSGDEVSPSELEPRPLEEIKAILPTNVGTTEGTTSNVVDTSSLEAPPEDPEMFKKMERLFEKYREMELRASVNDTPGGGGVVNGSGKANSSSDAQSSSGKPGSFSRSSSGKPALSIKTTSSGSHGSSSGGGGSATGKTGPKVSTRRQNSATSSDAVDNNARYKRTSSSPGTSAVSYPRHRMSRSAASSALNSPSVELREFTAPSEGCENRLRSVSHGEGHQETLMDIDPETAKNPTALISKIKEILKVRPRRDDNDKTKASRTRIPAPSTLSRSSRSKSVSNLFSERRMGQRGEVEGTNYDLRQSAAADDGNMEQFNGSAEVAMKRQNHGGSSGNISYSEFVFHADPEEADSKTGRELSRGWSVQSDSSDGQSRCETPAPKLATPLTTGRSTLMKRNGRGSSLEKENTLSTSQNSLSSRSAFSTTEEDADYV